MSSRQSPKFSKSYRINLSDEVPSSSYIREIDKKTVEESHCTQIMREKIVGYLMRDGVPTIIYPSRIPSYYDILRYGCSRVHATEALLELKQVGFEVYIDKDWSNDMMDNSPIPYCVKKKEYKT